MESRTLVRLGGLAAVAGGALRVAAEFAALLPSAEAIQIAYMVVDILLLLGLIALYARVAGRLGWIGLISFVLAIVGVCIVRTQGAFGAGAYAAGAGLWALGMAALGARMIMDRTMPRLAAGLWIATPAIALAAPFLPHGIEAQRFAAGAFALSFVVAGAWLIRSPEHRAA